jgi:hypothetical protein
MQMGTVLASRTGGVRLSPDSRAPNLDEYDSCSKRPIAQHEDTDAHPQGRYSSQPHGRRGVRQPEPRAGPRRGLGKPGRGRASAAASTQGPRSDHRGARASGSGNTSADEQTRSKLPGGGDTSDAVDHGRYGSAQRGGSTRRKCSQRGGARSKPPPHGSAARSTTAQTRAHQDVQLMQ